MASWPFSSRASCVRDVLWMLASSEPLLDLILHVVIRSSCIARPIPSDFLFLSDKGQKPNDEVADPLTQKERQAGGALGRRGGGLDPTSYPRCSRPETGGPGSLRMWMSGHS